MAEKLRSLGKVGNPTDPFDIANKRYVDAGGGGGSDLIRIFAFPFVFGSWQRGWAVGGGADTGLLTQVRNHIPLSLGTVDVFFEATITNGSSADNRDQNLSLELELTENGITFDRKLVTFTPKDKYLKSETFRADIDTTWEFNYNMGRILPIPTISSSGWNVATCLTIDPNS